MSSVKKAIGHLNTAAGVAGLIKCALCLDSGCLPASIILPQDLGEDPQLNLQNTPFYTDSLRPLKWNNGRFRVAAISSFGLGGTNASAILYQDQSHISALAVRSPSVTNSCCSLLLSAQCAESLSRFATSLADWIDLNETICLNDVAKTLALSRPAYTLRTYVLCDRSTVSSALRNMRDFWECTSVDGQYSVVLKDSLFCSTLRSKTSLNVPQNTGNLCQYYKNLGDNCNSLKSLPNAVDISCTMLHLRQSGLPAPSKIDIQTSESCVASAIVLALLMSDVSPTLIAKLILRPSDGVASKVASSLHIIITILGQTLSPLLLVNVFSSSHVLFDGVSAIFETQACSYPCLSLEYTKFPLGYNNIILQLWRDGVRVNWQAALSHFDGNFILLPGYQFCRKKYLNEGFQNSTSSASTYTFAITSINTVMSHKLYDSCIFPAAAYLAIIHNIKTPLNISDFKILKALIIYSPLMQVAVTSDLFQIYANCGDECFCTAQISLKKNWKQAFTSLPLEIREIDTIQFYNSLIQRGFSYGEEFRVVRAAYSFSGEKLFASKVEVHRKDIDINYDIITIDGCMQGCAIAAQCYCSSDSLWLPQSVQSVWISTRLPSELDVLTIVHSVSSTSITLSLYVRKGKESRECTEDLESFFQECNSLMKMENIELTKVVARKATQTATFHTVDWFKSTELLQQAQYFPKTSDVVIFSSDVTLSQVASTYCNSLTSRGCTAHYINRAEWLSSTSECSDVVIYFSYDFSNDNFLSSQVFEIVQFSQLCLKRKKSGPLYLQIVLFSHSLELSPFASAVLAICKSLCLEDGSLLISFVLLDTDYSASDLIEELKNLYNCKPLPGVNFACAAYKMGQRFVQQINSFPIDGQVAILSHLREQTVVILGSNGGIALEISKWLKQVLSVHLVGISRSSNKNVLISEHYTCDISDAPALKEILSNIHKHSPIRFIFHCAGISAPSIFSMIDEELIKSAFSAKVYGTLAIEYAIKDMLPLPQVLVFSSLAATYGSAGQACYAAANSAMESISNRNLFRTVSWCSWESIGMASSIKSTRRVLQTVSSQSALQILETVLGCSFSGTSKAFLVIPNGTPTLKPQDVYGFTETLDKPTDIETIVMDTVSKLSGVPVIELCKTSPIVETGLLDSLAVLQLLSILSQTVSPEFQITPVQLLQLSLPQLVERLKLSGSAKTSPTMQKPVIENQPFHTTFKHNSFLVIRQIGEKLPLFAIAPWACPGEWFKEFLPCTPNDQPFYALQNPCIEDPSLSASLLSFNQLAQEYVEIIRSISNVRGVALLGLSFSCLSACVTAMYLGVAGIPCKLVLVDPIQPPLSVNSPLFSTEKESIDTFLIYYAYVSILTFFLLTN